MATKQKQPGKGLIVVWFNYSILKILHRVFFNSMTTATKMVTPLKQTKTDLRSMQVVADHAQIDNTWGEYGYSGYNIMATNVKGEIAGPTGYKAQRQKTAQFPEPTLRCMMPAGQPFIPMEGVESVLHGLEKRITDTFPDAKKSGFKIEHIIRKHSHKGNTQHWVVQTNQEDTIKNSFAGKNDRIKLGFCIRNGYNTGVALGIDLFSFRLLCENGAVARGRDFEKQTIRHIGKDPKQLLKSFNEALMLAVEGWRDLLSLYGKMAVTNLNEKMAKYIYKNSIAADKYFPSYYHIERPKVKENPKEKVKELKQVPVITLDSKGRSITLWENFNDLTRPFWRAKDAHKEPDKDGEMKDVKPISFAKVAWQEKLLHDVMAHVIDN